MLVGHLTIDVDWGKYTHCIFKICVIAFWFVGFDVGLDSCNWSFTCRRVALYSQELEVIQYTYEYQGTKGQMPAGGGWFRTKEGSHHNRGSVQAVK